MGSSGRLGFGDFCFSKDSFPEIQFTMWKSPIYLFGHARQMVGYSQELTLEGNGQGGGGDSGPLNSESMCPEATAIKYIS